jgi:hypothetical protein
MTDRWIRDTGLVFALLCMVLAYRYDVRFLILSGGLLLAVMFIPALLKPLAYLWMRIAEALGMVMNKVFFGIVFFIVVTPIGFMRRLISGDNRDLTLNRSKDSVFVEREGLVKKEALMKPY